MADLAPGRGTPRTAPRRRLWWVGLAVALVVGVIELLGFTAWWVGTGQPFTFATAASLRAIASNEAAGDVAPAAAPAKAALQYGIAVHPFLGFVNDPTRGPVAGYPVSPWGFLDSASPLRQAAADRFVIGIVGGSVSLLFGLYGEAALVAALQRSEAFAGRQIEVVRLGLGGYKQPQQLFAVQLTTLLGGHFDCIVNLDGFNEIALVEENVPFGVPAWYPRSWARLVERAPSREQLLQLGRLALGREERAAAAAAAATWWWSPTLQFVWWAADQRWQRRLVELQAAIESAPSTAGYAATGPGAGDGDVEAARAAMATVWAQGSIALHQCCQRRGIQYVHCLQPNQYVPGQTPIGAAEARVAVDSDSVWARAVANGYPLLRAQVPALLAAGVPFTDLTGVFAGHDEPLYVDTCCHLGPAGNAILAEHIAAAIRRPREVGAAAVQRLEVPPRLELGPLAAVPLPVVGLAADATRRDLRGAGMGTTLQAEPAARFERRADGSVFARGRGMGHLVVRHGACSATVELSARWPDLVVGTDAVPGPGGLVPQLAIVFDAAGGLEVRGQDLPAAPLRLLAVGTRPLPDRPSGAQPFGFQLLPLPAEAGPVQLRLPAPDGNGLPQFVRLYALAVDAATLVAASNTVVVTRG